MRCPRLAWLALVLAGACATTPDAGEGKSRPGAPSTGFPADAGPAATAPADTAPAIEGRPIPAAPAAETWGGLEFREVNQKRWLADVRNKLAERLKVDPARLLVSPGMLRLAFVRDPAESSAPKPPRRGRPRPRRFQIVVVDNQGRLQATFRPVTMKGSDEPPKDLRFLSEDRLVYEVVASPPPPETPAARAAPAKPPPTKRAPPPAPARADARPSSKKPDARRAVASVPPPAASPPPANKPAPPPGRLFIIQPVAPRARPIRCEGRHFAFSAGGDHLAFVGGAPEAGYVAVDGQPVYPRRGRTVIASPVAWSKDGHSVAFVESPAKAPARLVLLAEFDNATGDTTWNLPPAASIEGVRVFWAAAGHLIVGKSPTHPLFSASFQKLR
ncbi:MAG TPA: hypothetical protein VMU50_22085 [Polyangia bacterium]|nr:hypothetical protein [Polyangia bacterium]